MERQKTIEKLAHNAPCVLDVCYSGDMGYEFTAIVPTGVIYPEAGMLLEYSGGEWPPDAWEGKSEQESEELLKAFLLDESWTVTTWNSMSDDEIEELFELLEDEV